MDNLTPQQRRKNMQNIRSKGTKPEQKVFAELKRLKIYFVSHVDKIIGKPDIVFRRKKVVVFIDSDFWHGHPERYPPPKSNQEYWEKKIARNRQRDNEVNQVLRTQGWNVIRLWEYDIKNSFDECIAIILDALDRTERSVNS